jgi:hypothetical protein
MAAVKVILAIVDKTVIWIQQLSPGLELLLCLLRPPEPEIRRNLCIQLEGVFAEKEWPRGASPMLLLTERGRWRATRRIHLLVANLPLSTHSHEEGPLSDPFWISIAHTT